MKTGAEAIRALATQLPAFRQKLSDGWYQVRIAGRDVSTSGLTAQLHETLPDGAVIHIVPRVAGAKSGGVFQIVLGAAAIAGSFFTAGATLAAWGAAIGAGGMTGILFSLGASMVLGGVAQMLAPKARTPRTQTTDNGKQNTYFSSLDIDMPAGQGTLTLTFTVSSSGANNWTPTTSISDLLVVVMKKSTAGISIS